MANHSPPHAGFFFRLNVNQAGGLYLFGRSGHYDHSDNDLNQNFSLKNDVSHVVRKTQNPVDF
ncbi:hypothetical protein DTY81_05410 [Escherichia coli]|nr:hypothetical protein [Escherichia coli]EGD5142768.1 hypothetical protein [Escherichia coli]